MHAPRANQEYALPPTGGGVAITAATRACPICLNFQSRHVSLPYRSHGATSFRVIDRGPFYPSRGRRLVACQNTRRFYVRERTSPRCGDLSVVVAAAPFFPSFEARRRFALRSKRKKERNKVRKKEKQNETFHPFSSVVLFVTVHLMIASVFHPPHPTPPPPNLRGDHRARHGSVLRLKILCPMFDGFDVPTVPTERTDRTVNVS